jgi:preprotein translocase subunit SecD
VRKRRARWTVAGIFALVAAAGAYLLGINPIINHITQGLDLQGGLYVVFQAEPTPNSPVTPQAMQTAVQVMRFRVDALGVAEPQIQQEGADRIVVQLPGVKNADEALKTIGQTGQLEFRDSTGQQVIVTGKDLVSAHAQYGPGNDPQVALQFDAAGAKAIAAYTSANVGKTMPIYLDGKQIADPIVESPIPSGQGVIDHMESLQAAQALAVELNSGALPVALKVIQNNTVSATLGADSIRASKAAAAIAVALVAAFMLIVYRIPGFWAVFALAVYAMLLLGVLAAINATLTLPGITGLILSIGMAVDSNVIIYERIKEELRAGRTLRSAVDEGFRNGLRAVYDSNATTVIAALVLFWLGTGPIRGFAVTVGIGVLISLLTAVTFTKYLLHRLIEAGARPSFWFFAPRAEVAVAGAAAGAGGGVRAAEPAATRSGFTFQSVEPPPAAGAGTAPAAGTGVPTTPATPASGTAGAGRVQGRRRAGGRRKGGRA